jgi:hypothetical protein
MSACNALIKFIEDYYTRLRPKEIEKSECVIKLLEGIYPTVNWSNVHFYNGLPWFIPSSSGTSAITLPGTYGINQIHIYFANYSECDCAGLSTIVHEGYHALQYTDAGVNGIGFVHPFMIQYLACWVSNNFQYDNHPMEIVAYEYEQHFQECCRKLQGKKICDCKTRPATFNPDVLVELLKICPNLVKQNSGFIYNCGILPAILGFVLSLIILLLLLSADSILFFLAIIIFISTVLVCIFENICKLSIIWEKKCKEYGEETRRECSRWSDNGKYECSQWADQGRKECSRWSDNGKYECSQWADQGSNECCNWWPCSWGCRAFYWVANWVCQGWYWVANWVCQGWYWVANWVCQGWYWIANWVCQLWAIIVVSVCVAFTWVIKKITCW